MTVVVGFVRRVATAALMAMVPSAVAVSASAQDKVAHACPIAGTKTKSSAGNDVLAEGGDGFTCVFKLDNTRTIHRYAGFAILGSPFGDTAKLHLDKLWPLEVGKKVSYQWTPPGGRDGTVTFEVKRKEKVTVPAGTFDTFVVTQTVAFIGSYEGEHTFYYSPETATGVKMTFVAKQGVPNPTPVPWELVSRDVPK
jgi:hypothetical protein